MQKSKKKLEKKQTLGFEPSEYFGIVNAQTEQQLKDQKFESQKYRWITQVNNPGEKMDWTFSLERKEKTITSLT